MNRSKLMKILEVGFGFFVMLVFSMGQTWSYVNDTETSEGNSFGAATLDMTLTSDTDNFEPAVPMMPGESVLRNVTITNVGGLDFDYSIGLELTGGDTELCSALVTDIGGTGSLISGASTTFHYTVTLPSGASSGAQDMECTFNVRAYAWQPELGTWGLGFWDTEVLGNVVTSEDWGETELDTGGVVLNEIFANPAGPEDAPMPGGEWVELFNTSGVDIDVAGWNLYDAYDYHRLEITVGNTNTGSTVVPAHGFLVVYRNGDIDFSLNNSGDTVRLYNGTIGGGLLVDVCIYGPVIEGKSIARIPDGTGEWIDPIPTPGEPNQLEEVLPPISEPTTVLVPSTTPVPTPSTEPTPILTEEPIPEPTVTPEPSTTSAPTPTEEPILTEEPIPTPIEEPTPEPTASPEPILNEEV